MAKNNSRTVKAQHLAQRHDIGSLITRIALPNAGISQVDPFLLLAHHGPQIYPPNNEGLPFGPHPHRGFETVTFIRSGSLAHRDSGGHESLIHAGGAQWMTAGSGLVHAEVSSPAFRQHGGPLEILQLWLNLPARLKMTAPRYSGLEAERIPAIPLNDGGGTLNLISGTFAAVSGPIRSLTDVFMATVALKAGASADLPAPHGRSVFLYVVEGRGLLAGTEFDKWQLQEMHDDGEAIPVEAAADAFLLFGHAQPLGEPVVAQGPFVMNTQMEIEQAARDYRAGKFGEVTDLLEVGR